jgi:FG-GAP-like repeat
MRIKKAVFCVVSFRFIFSLLLTAVATLSFAQPYSYQAPTTLPLTAEEFIVQANTFGAQGFSNAGRYFSRESGGFSPYFFARNAAKQTTFTYEAIELNPALGTALGTTLDAFIALVNSQGARGYKYVGQQFNAQRRPAAVFVNDQSSGSYTYEAMVGPGNPQDFVVQANAQGARGFQHLFTFFIGDLPTQPLQTTSFYVKNNSRQATFTYEVLNTLSQPEPSAYQYLTNANAKGARQLRYAGSVNLSGIGYSIHEKDSTERVQYKYMQPQSEFASVSQFIDDANARGEKGFRYVADVPVGSTTSPSLSLPLYEFVAPVPAPNDLSGDGKSDILLQNVATSTVSALLMNGTAVSSTANLLNNDPNWTITHTGDFDRDGKADILWRKADGAVTIWTMNGTTVTSTAGLTGADANWNVMHVGDFNGDGYADLLWRNNNGAVTLWLMNGTTIMSAIGLLGPDANWSVSHIGDFNGDGKADILWRNIDGSVTMWLMNGGTVTSAVGILGVDPNWRVSHVADFNGDGKTDLLWRKANGSVTMWLMDGTAVTSATGILGPDAKWNVSHTADFNGDGKADLLWVNYDTEAVTIWLMNGATVTSAAGIYAGFPPGLPRPTLPFFVWRVIQTQDLNGDGKADLVWSKFDGSTTVWLLDGTAVTATSGLTGPGSRVLPTGPLGSTVVLPI